MSARCNSWTETEDETLKRLYLNEGKVIREVALEMGRTMSSVSNRINVIGAIKTGARKRWSKEEQQTLNRWFEEGKTDQEIGDLLGRDAMAVKTRRRYSKMLKQDCTRWEKSQIETLVQLVEQGQTKEEIADTMGMTLGRVKNKIKMLGIISRRRYEKWPAEEKSRLVELLDSGLSLDEISAMMSRPHEGIISKCKQLRVAHRYDSIRRFLNAKQNAKIDCLEERVKYVLRNAKSRAGIKGMAFDLTVEGIKSIYASQKGLCFYSGLPMTFKTNDSALMSVDRIDSNGGYTLDNVVLTAWAVNAMKQDFDVETFLSMARRVSLQANIVRGQIKERSLLRQPPPQPQASARSLP
jgi:DNA-binding CsgD family transcriptional regulator